MFVFIRGAYNAFYPLHPPPHAKKLASFSRSKIYQALFVSALCLGTTSVAYAVDITVDDSSIATYSGNAVSPSSASNNTVTINFTSGTDYVNDVYGGTMTTGASNGNTVNIVNGDIRGHVYGGFADRGSSNNTVKITGGTITGHVYGGSSSGFGTGYNTVYLKNVALDKNNYFVSGGTRAKTGNTLILSGKNSAYSAYNFEHYRFLVDDTVNADDTMLSVDVGNPVELIGTTVGVAVSGSTSLQQGDSITLIDKVTGTLDPAKKFNASDEGFLNTLPLETVSQARTIVNTGLINSYEFDIDVNTSNALIATLTKAGVDDSRLAQAKALSEGMVGSVAFINQGADLASGRGMDAAMAATAGATATSPKAAAFGVAQGGHSRYKTGSHVNVDGANFMLGVAFNHGTQYGNFMLAPFVEAGWGNYGSYNSFSNAPSVSGHGDSYYYGLGSLVRFDFNDIAYGHPYVEGSLRVGHSKADFSSNDIKDSTGKRASYDSEGMYYGAHVGGGYVFNLTDKDTLDTYLKYFWTHQDSDTVKVLGDKVHFDDVDSSRLRVGTRYSHNVKVDGYDLKPYVGVAFEREFDGKARAKVNRYDVDAPTLKGNTGMLEVGLSFKPQSVQNMSIDFGLEAYTGRREGVVGSLKAYYAF